ncbi:MAG TPA: helical backbone metal receptor [Candidatus Aquilonibacter sp.]|nr:helical backbone metal receptor [Candidatus Aquilonibacter sp.]
MVRAAIVVAMALCVAAGTQAPARADANRVVIDDVGRRVVIPAQVNRIVSLAPNLTETVYALGLDDKLAGDTDLCDTPEAAKQKPHVGNPQNPSLEEIVALRPDLVLATTSINVESTADALAHLGIAVYTTAGDTQTVLAMLDSIHRVAGLMGAEAQGEELVTRLRARLDALHAQLADRPMEHVLFVVWEDPLISLGQNTFIADALRWAGAESIVQSDQNWPHIGLEEVVKLQPDYIVFAGGHGDSAESELADLRAKPIWRDLDAVEAGHVVNLNEESIRPSPGLVDAIEQLARAVHPEAFSEKSEIRNAKTETRGPEER